MTVERRGARFARATVVAVLLLAGLLIIGVAGCGSEDEGDPTSDLSTASTGSAITLTTAGASTTTSPGSTGTTGEGADSGDQTFELGTRRNPIPLGEEAQVGDWSVTVVGAKLDATRAVLDENMFNDQPGDGSQYVLVMVEATYIGEQSSTFWIDLLYTFVGEEGDAYGPAPAVAPDSMTNQGEVFSGDTVSGNLVFVADSEQVSGGTLLLEEAFAHEVSRVFFAVE